MAREEIRDRDHHLLGYLGDLGGGRELRDSNNRLIGRYNSDRDETRDANNRLVGPGDRLLMLL